MKEITEIFRLHVRLSGVHLRCERCLRLPMHRLQMVTNIKSGSRDKGARGRNFVAEHVVSDRRAAAAAAAYEL